LKNKRVCLHLHFDLPPREDPWLEEARPDPAQAPWRDALERYFHSCLGPLLSPCLLDEDGRPLEVFDTLRWASFSFPAHLLAWLEREEPRAYRSVLEADAASLKAWGHGNAAACPYPSRPLPWASTAEKRAALAWGLEDFRRRFGREPETLWLPEGLADEETLALAVKAGLRLALLSPACAAKVRSPGQEAWSLTEPGALETTRPYRWRCPEGSLALFLFDARLSESAEAGVLTSPLDPAASRPGRRPPQARTALHGGRRLANRLVDRFRADDSHETMLVAAPAEAFSRERFGAERALAFAFDALSKETAFSAANPALCLDLFPPPEELSLRPLPGPPAHPLRRSLARLAEDIDSALEAPLQQLFGEPGGAKEAWMEARFGEDPHAVQVFFDRFALLHPTPEDARSAVRLLECFRRRVEMTAWPGPQALAWAAFALELLERETGAHRPFPAAEEALREAVSPEAFAAHAAVLALLDLPRLAARAEAFETQVEALARRELRRGRALHRLGVFRVSLHRRRFHEDSAFLAAVVHRGGRSLECRIQPACADESDPELARRLEEAFETGDDAFTAAADEAFGAAHRGLDAVLSPERRQALDALSPPPGPRGEALARWREAADSLERTPDVLVLAEALKAARKAGLSPDNLPDAELLRRRVRRLAWAFSDGEEGACVRLVRLLEPAEAGGLHLSLWELEACAVQGLRRLETRPDEAETLARMLGLSPALLMVQPPLLKTGKTGDHR